MFIEDHFVCQEINFRACTVISKTAMVLQFSFAPKIYIFCQFMQIVYDRHTLSS